ncbi:MAG: SPFH domain-containing protein [Chloroflexota bacterium]|nr:SPFH domain-containing protein [Chloroflexota bacterium]
METWLAAVIIIVGAILLIALVALSRSIVIVHQGEKGIVERLGRYKEVLEPGLKFIVPFVEAVVARVDMRERVIDVPPQSVITKDNVGVMVDAVIYYYVADAKAVRYEVANFWEAISKLAQTNLRNLVGDLSLDETLTSRERINSALRIALDEATDRWGVKVTRVEVKEIEPPKDITDAMSKQMKAEREKRATILSAEAYRDKQILEAQGDKDNMVLRAEGEKQKAILTAEGDKQQEILTAEADREAAILRAEGEARAIEQVSKAADKFFVGNAQLLKQLDVTQASLADNTKIVVSDQSKLINVLGLGEKSTTES